MSGADRPSRRVLTMFVGTAATIIASTGMAVANSKPHIASVNTSGTSARPEITVKGTAFGKRPAPDPRYPPAGKSGCPVSGPTSGAGHLFGTNLYFTNLKASKGTYKNWSAGEFTRGGSGFFDCVGIVIDRWTSNQVRFHFGNTYGKFIPQNTYFFSNRDRFEVFVRGAKFVTNAKLR